MELLRARAGVDHFASSRHIAMTWSQANRRPPIGKVAENVTNSAMVTDMRDTDDVERDLRLELMRLDRKLKLRDLGRMDQQLVYGPVKLLLFTVSFTGGLLALLLFLWLA